MFLGLFGVGNLGNEASLRAGIEAARRLNPEASLGCVCAFPDRVEREHQIPAYSLRTAGRLDLWSTRSRVGRAFRRPVLEVARWGAAYRLLRRVDHLVVPGTGILDDFGVRPWQMPSDLLRWSLLARFTHTRLSYVGIGAGPINRRASRWLLRAALRQASDCSFRDEESRAFMTSIGRDTSRDRVIPDLAFALAPPPGPHTRELAGCVGLGVMAWYGWSNSPTDGEQEYRRYLDSIVRTARSLAARGQAVRLLVGEDADKRAVEDLTAAIHSGGTPVHLIAEPIRTMRDLLAQIAQTDVVVGTRYHNIVAALIVGRPVVSLGYAEKNRSLLNQVGLAEYCQSVDAIDPQAVAASVTELLDSDGLTDRLTLQTADWRRQIDEEFSRLLPTTRASTPAGEFVAAEASRT